MTHRRLTYRLAVALAAILSIFAVTAAVAAGEPTGKASRFLTGPNAGDAHDVAMAYISSNLDALGLTAADLDGIAVQDRYTTRHNGVTHLYFHQRSGGIDVYNAIFTVNVAADGSIISVNNRFVGDLAAKVGGGGPALSDRQAIERAATHFALDPAGLAPLETAGGPDQRAVFAGAGLSRENIPVRLVYQPLEDGRVRLAWLTSLYMLDSPDFWNVRVDALTGEVLGQYNFTNYDSYQVIPFPPFSDPEDSGGQSVVVDPADLNFSPFGWHDTNGVPGAESTLTEGNNVFAQDDLDGNNGGGLSPDGGASLDFLFPFDPNLQPTGGTNLEAAIVNLFYGNNVMHDLTACYGFDEASGNFQVTNYTGMGLGNDWVEADAQDGSGTDNANFLTRPEGVPGSRMQMFIWTNPFGQLVTVNSPPSIAGDYVANPSNAGGTAMGLTADLEIVDDGVAPTTDACEPVNNDLTGKIALIVWNQGACNSSVFVANAAAAGAVAAIIIDNSVNPTTNFGGSPTIPSVGVGSEVGQSFIDAIDGGDTVNATIDDNPDGTINRDSDMDNGIIAHEYGHGISNRLTGGPASVTCLSGTEQGGEGWSDFWTLVLTAKSSDTPTLQKGVGNYVIFEPVNGPGIRNFPYTTDISVNPLHTYGEIDNTNVPHGVGEIWMSMLWEMYWELTLKHGFDCDFCTGTGGNNLTIQLVVDGMKMQGCDPSFLDARDGILAADAANNGGANECEIWRAFAKRGAGFSAMTASDDVGDEFPATDLPPGCPAVPPSIFTDGFECGDTARWANTVGLID